MNQPMSQPNQNESILKIDDPVTIQNWFIDRLTEKLSLNPDQIDVQAPLDSYGLDSAQAMSLISEGEEWLGFEISPMLLWHYPTIEALSQRLAEEFEDSELEAFEF